MTQPVLIALAVALIGCQRNHTTTDEEAGRPAKSVAPAAPGEPAAPAAAAAQAPVAAAGSWQLSPLGRDLERICNVLTYAGVADGASGRLNAILDWLPRNIESEEGREFLGSIGDLQGAAKADALDAGARKVGLADCPLALEWRK